MKIYHKVWLEAHPHRNEDWLQDHLRDGFDIHHIDGDHSNNDAANLILVEAADHMLLHGMTKDGAGVFKRFNVSLGPKKKTLEIGRASYFEAKAVLEGDSHPRSIWDEVAQKVGCSRTQAVVSARTWARHTQEAWPIVLSLKCYRPEEKIKIKKVRSESRAKVKPRPIKKFFDTSYCHDYVPPRRVVGHR